MKKKITGFLMCFVMLCMTLFAGCSLIETDSDRYYNAVISEIRNKDGVKVAEVTKRELLAGYQSYGQTFEQYSGMTRKEAVDATLKLLEDRKITVAAAEKLFTLSPLEKTYLWESTYVALEQNLKSYYDEIVSPEEGTEENSSVTFNGYEKNATLKVVGETYQINKINKNQGLLENYTPSVSNKDVLVEEDKLMLYQNFLDSLYNKDYVEAFNTYLKNLKIAEEGLSLSKDTKSVFMREIDRLYKINYENLLVEKYSQHNRELYKDNTGVTAQNILDLYTSKVRSAYTKYVFENNSSYDNDISNGVNNVYYFKNDSDATKYFTVSNILFQFSEEQKSLYNSYKARYENQAGDAYTYAQYQQDVDALYTQIQPIVRQKNSQTGAYEEIEAGNLNVDEIIYDEIEIALKSAQATGDKNFIGDTINEYIYKYNQDPGMLNAEANYVIGVDKEGKAVSSFVESFNDAGLDLYDNGAGEIGDMAIAKSEYGIHVLVYTGKCENLFDGIDGKFDLNDSVESGAIEKLYSTRINPLVDKTYFDLLYDEIYQDKFSYYENENLKYIKSDYQIKVYRGRIPSSLLKD